MKNYNIIITGATGMVGEGVLLHCLVDENIASVLSISRRPLSIKHPKLKELLVKDFNAIDEYFDELKGYDACFYCAGVSSVGMDEAQYTQITYTTTIAFAKTSQKANPNMVFSFVSGAHTKIDGKQMWQRVKGKTEADLMQLGFKSVYNFRPGFMKPVKGQQHVKWFFKPLIAIFPLLLPSQSLTLHQVGQAMINTIGKGSSNQILEIKDIKQLASLAQ